MKYTDIRGIIVPILTPMDENEQINLALSISGRRNGS